MNKYKQLVSIFLIMLLIPFDAVLAKDSRLSKQAHTLMQAFFDASDTPGLAVSVGLGGTIIWSEGFGYADLEQLVKLLVLPRTSFGLDLRNWIKTRSLIRCTACSG